ncbi:hypothetical protein [Lactobacillus sp. 3B(2020)]|uniref:hypothetical protein n=1 Tax=Lactobacillus sp. 3B(2020) TaxID=2695882 RepID=UPI0015DD6571|nr:hypothetical protein [Lactobacillus sp. 3B(2020)]QLL69845.1 hypothetical protein GTO83_04480 [Lactobacillus sp. 3B(2020)]
MLIEITRHKRKFKFVRPYYWKITIIDPKRPKEWPAEVGYLDRATGPNHQPMPGWQVDMYYPYNTVDDGVYLPDDLPEDEAVKEALEIAQEILEKFRAQWDRDDGKPIKYMWG